MSWTSTPERYGRMAIAIHWLTALAVIGLLTSGTILEDMADDATKTSILRVHAIMGSIVLLLTILRIGWWWFIDRRPAPVAGIPRWQERLSRITHVVLYLLLIVMGASGLAMIVLSDAGQILFAGAAGPLPEFRDLPPRAAHGLGANALFLFAGLHIAAALFHQFVRRDRLLGRMGIGRA